MLMEMMGLHLPGAAFVNPNTPLRDALTVAAAKRAVQISIQGSEYTPIGKVIDEKSVVNAIAGLLATGGSTNHTMHLVAMAYAAGILINWDDFSELSAVVPLLARVYPNGKADVNQFHNAGGMGFVVGQLLDAGLVHADVTTVAGEGGLHRYRQEPYLEGSELRWRDAAKESRDPAICAPAGAPFSTDGGLKVLSGNLGRAVIKTSAVKSEHRVVEAPAMVFETQEAVMKAFKAGQMKKDAIVVVRYQGPRANGMPELHKLTPILGVMQDEGLKVALVTDGRMSGASGKIPAAIHVTPECVNGGPLAKVRTGDMIRLDAEAGRLDALVSEAEWNARGIDEADLRRYHHGIGRELFGVFRAAALGAEQGAMSFVTAEAAEAIPVSHPLPVHDEFVFAETAEER
jgi:phosphogluconate dehydratase